MVTVLRSVGGVEGFDPPRGRQADTGHPLQSPTLTGEIYQARDRDKHFYKTPSGRSAKCFY
nr:hypothetical protein 7 [bacterium]